MTAVDGRAGRAARFRTGLLARIAIWAVFAVLLAYMTVQSVGNLVTVSRSVQEFNAFIASSSGGDSLRRAVPWVWLVLDIVIAPLAFVVALWVTRRSTLAVTAAVFLLAFAAAGALWLDLQLFVPRLLDF
ncbi:hypothetical protein DEJ16_11845 [Curtobacterium sp. MCJR17_055]|uniref:hypothetical protein n=1 Tax=unclassified Curtobacterium TaxID=257496 RepID=UPI000D9F9452|nr:MULTISPECIES: hypothetical protein [unclassified Curtobacterium]PYY35918.1 hypothetical protein DEI87_05025 [Curtobacterium sp. MCBD17_029]PYY54981.1 hypothetical protein DEJ16_11845 [Curtobacterium sp. MCJR17_055]PYY61217.1 hypothetical protein DEJ26_04995 [Curtobacterium sp. MCPF17_015]WIB35223.1 hypothetical protein DEJ15_12795 [Curtobacterium sp. MCJR17_043]